MVAFIVSKCLYPTCTDNCQQAQNIPHTDSGHLSAIIESEIRDNHRGHVFVWCKVIVIFALVAMTFESIPDCTPDSSGDIRKGVRSSISTRNWTLKSILAYRPAEVDCYVSL